MIRNEFLQAALLGAVLLASIAMLSQWRAFRRMRLLVQRDLARIFEQVDLMRLDAQQLPIADAAPALRVAAPPVLDSGLGYAAALELAARGADEHEITTRCGLSSAEARILVAMRGLQGRPREIH